MSTRDDDCEESIPPPLPPTNQSSLRAPSVSASVLRLRTEDLSKVSEQVRSGTFEPWRPDASVSQRVVSALSTQRAPRTSGGASGTLPRFIPATSSTVETGGATERFMFTDTQNTTRTAFLANVRRAKVCLWCMRPLPSEGVVHGVPVSRDSKGAYVCEGSFCTHNRLACAFAWLLRELDRRTGREMMESSLTLIHNMHAAMYPNDYHQRQLIPAADYRLLAQNGGTMSDEEFDKYTSRAWIASRASPDMSAATTVMRSISFMHVQSDVQDEGLVKCASPMYVTVTPFVKCE